MKINVKYASVMKCEMSTGIDVLESTTLKELKQKIFDIFWEAMKHWSGMKPHGSWDQIVLTDEGGNIVKDDDALKKQIDFAAFTNEMLGRPANFSAVFNISHPSTPAIKNEKKA